MIPSRRSRRVSGAERTGTARRRLAISLRKRPRDSKPGAFEDASQPELDEGPPRAGPISLQAASKYRGQGIRSEETSDPSSAKAARSGNEPRTGSVFGLVLANYGTQFISLISGPVLARAIGPTGRGAVAVVSVYNEASSRVFNCGLPQAVGFFAKEGLAPPEGLLGAVRRYGVITFPLAVLVGVLVVTGPLSSLSIEARIAAFLLVAMSPVVNTFGTSCSKLLLSRGDLAALRRLTLIPSVLNATLILVAASLGVLNVPVVLAGTVTTSLVTSAYAWRLSHTRIAKSVPIAGLLAYGVRALPGSLSDLANNRLDQLLIMPFLGLRSLGIYAVAVGVNFVPLQFGTAMAMGTFSRVRRSDAPGRRSPAAASIRRAWIVATIAAAAVACAVPVGLPLLYGERFRDAVGPTLLLLPGTVMYAVHLVTSQCANALGKPQYSSCGQILAVALTGVGLPLVLPRFGLAGAAVVSSFAYTTRLVVTQVLLRRVGVRGTVPGRDDLQSLVRHARRSLRRLAGRN